MYVPVASRWSRAQAHRLSQGVTIALVAACLGSFLYTPESGLGWAVDILLRSYLMFLCTVMAHEASHGHLGANRSVNDWFGRLALLGPMVPYVGFRKTHRMHHAKTNEPGEDPDLYIKPNHWWEIPFRAVAIPHSWLGWLRARGWLTRQDLKELALSYVVLIGIYTPLGLYVGPTRFLIGAVPALVLVSVLLWYPFALRTHEGWSQGAAEERSHNYYGAFAFWFSLGLSMHRTHHQHPRLAWIQLLPYVERSPSGLPFRRDIRVPAARAS